MKYSPGAPAGPGLPGAPLLTLGATVEAIKLADSSWNRAVSTFIDINIEFIISFAK